MSSVRQGFHSLFNMPVPATIKIANKLLVDGGVVEEVSPHAFAQRVGMKGWEENVMVGPALSGPLGEDEFPGQTIDDAKCQQIVSEVAANAQKLLIANMGGTGWGVFALQDIPRLSYVLVYAGMQYPAQKNRTHAEAEYSFAIQGVSKEVGFVEAREFGNTSRFLQHAAHIDIPEEHRDPVQVCLTDYKYSSIAVRNKVAYANLASFPHYYKGSSMQVFQACEDIRKGEALTFDYGKYWVYFETHPILFFRDGREVPFKDYEPNRKLVICGGDIKKDNELHYVSINSWFDTKDLGNRPIKLSFAIEKEFGLINLDREVVDRTIQQTPKKSPYLFFKLPKIVYTNEDIDAANPAEGICRQLGRISKNFTNIVWKYSALQKTAYLQHDDEQVIRAIANFLESHSFKIKSGLNPNTNPKRPLLYVLNPGLQDLCALEESCPNAPALRR